MTEPGSPADYTAHQVEAAQAIYTPAGLSIYDLVVLGFSNRFIWRCPTRRILDLYDDHVSLNHLDVGVGTGYYLAHSRFPGPSPRIVLFDLNQNCLQKAAQTIRQYSPTIVRGSLLDPIGGIGEPFDSISCTYVLHCLPGSPSTKKEVLGRLAGLLTADGVLFGATTVRRGVPISPLARFLMRQYERRGIFNNSLDHADHVRQALETHFQEWDTQVHGCVILFRARRPRTP